MTPQDYMDEILLPSLAAYEADTSSRRLAYLACITMFHLKDFLEKAGVETPEVEMLKHCEAAWNVVHAVAVGAKHADNLDRPSKKNPIKFVAGTDDYRPPAVAGLMECGWSECGDEEGSIVIPVVDEGDDNLALEADLLYSLRTVLLQYRKQFPMLVS